MKWIAPAIIALMIYSIVMAEFFVIMGSKLEELDPFLDWFVWFMACGLFALLLTICFKGRDWPNVSSMPKNKK
jgi:hypothetical protein